MSDSLKVIQNQAHSSDLQCDWTSWFVVEPRHLGLILPAGNCCDMTGAIKIAEILMPNAHQISAFVNSKLDIQYFKISAGHWVPFVQEWGEP